MPSPIPLDVVQAGVVMWESIGPIVAITAFAVQFVGTIIAGIWKLSQVDAGLRQAINISGKEIDERIDKQRREYGETAMALRTKITEVELYVRDNYVRRDSFYKVSGDLTTSLEKLGDKIEARIDRLEAEINNERRGGAE